MAHILRKLNNAFYAMQSTSFAQTRQSPWHGWKTCLETLPKTFWNPLEDKVVLDLACGNMRFEEFLFSEKPNQSFECYCFDSTETLMEETIVRSARENQSIIPRYWDVLADMHTIPQAIPPVHLSVCFGFFHHIALPTWRDEVFQFLVDATKTNGYIFISFWRFLEDETFAKKANTVHEQALKDMISKHWKQGELNTSTMNGFVANELDGNDRFLGWKNNPGVYRYAHSFSDEEIAALVSQYSSDVELVHKFYADGKRNNLNCYVVLRKK